MNIPKCRVCGYWLRKVVFVVLSCGIVALPATAQTDLAASASPSTPTTPAPTPELPFLNLRLVKPPEFPASMIARKQASEVDAVVRITREGRFKEVLSLRSNPVATEAEEGLRALLPQWTFRPAFNDRCEPIESEGQIKLWFDLENGRPSVSVARVKQDRWFKPQPGQITNFAKVAETLQENYPRNARREHSGAEAVVAVEVETQSGRVLNTRSTYVQLDWDTPDSSLYGYFTEAAEKSMRIATFAPRPGHTEPRWVHCQRISYSLKIDLERDDLRNSMPVVRDPAARSTDQR